MDLDDWWQRHKEMLQEAEQNRLAKALRARGKTQGGRVSPLIWELRRVAGLLLKFSKSPKNWGKGAKP